MLYKTKQEKAHGNEKCGKNLFDSVEVLEDEVKRIFQKLVRIKRQKGRKYKKIR